MNKKIALKITLLLLFIGCNNPKKENNKLGEVFINKQIWSKTNLNSTNFRNGDKIPYAKSNDEWKSASTMKTPAWAWSNDENGSIILYNWYAITDSRGLAPKGWRIPKSEDWDMLSSQLQENKEGQDLLSTNCGGVDKFGFSAEVSGIRNSIGQIENRKSYAHFWTSTTDQASTSIAYSMKCDDDKIYRFSLPKSYGCSVRLIKGKSAASKNEFESFKVRLNTVVYEKGLSRMAGNSDNLEGLVVKEYRANDGGRYKLLQLVAPLYWRIADEKIEINYLVVGGKFKNVPLTKSSKDTMIFIAIVTDESLVNDTEIDFNKALPVGSGKASAIL